MELTPTDIAHEYRQMEAALRKANIPVSITDGMRMKVVTVGRRSVSFDTSGWSSITIPPDRTFVRKVPLKDAAIWLMDGLVEDED